MNPDSALFFLGEKFRYAIVGDNEDEENDEYSVINDLEFFLTNYEEQYEDKGYTTVLEHQGWDCLKQVVWVRRNSAKHRELWVEEPGEKSTSQVVFLPKGTTEENACWIVKAVMKSI